MKQFFEILFDKDKSFDNLQVWVYAIAIPLGLLVLMAIAGWMDQISESL